MKQLILDLSPTYIPFLVQCTKAAGDKVDPTVDNLIIYEEGGADATFDSTQVTGSPFDPAQVNSKTGLWGVLVAKSVFTAGKCYIALWEMTVDGVTTAKVEKYLAKNSSEVTLDEMKGATWNSATDTLEHIRDAITALTPVAHVASGRTLTYGTETNAYTDTQTANSTHHQINCVAVNGLDIQYTFTIGTNTRPQKINIIGRYEAASPAANHYVETYAYNYLTAGWDKISTVDNRMEHSTSDQNYSYVLNEHHFDPATGNAIIRFVGADVNTLYALYLDYLEFATTAGSCCLSLSEISDAVCLRDVTASLDPATFLNRVKRLVAVTTEVSASDTASSFTIAAGKASDDAYKYMLVRVTDLTDGNIETRWITGYTSGRVVTLDEPLSFTPDVDDEVRILNMYIKLPSLVLADYKATGYSTHSAADVWTNATRTLSSFGTLITDMWHHLLENITTASSIGKLIKDYLNATIDSRQPAGSVDLNPDQSGVTIGTTNTNADMRGTDGALTDKAGFSLSTVGILAIWHQLLANIETAGSIGRLIKDYLDAAISSRISRIEATEDKEAIITEIDANEVKLDTLLTRLSASVATALTKLADAAIAGTETAGSLFKLFYDRVTGAVALDSTVAKADALATVNGIVDDIKEKTKNIPADPASSQHLVGGAIVYNSTNRSLIINAYVEKDGELQTAPTSATCSIYDADGLIVGSQMSDASPDSHGVFKFTQELTTVLADEVYYAKIEIILNEVTHKGMIPMATAD